MARKNNTSSALSGVSDTSSKPDRGLAQASKGANLVVAKTPQKLPQRSEMPCPSGVGAWMKMVCDPYGSDYCRSPAVIGTMGTTARVVKQFSMDSTTANTLGWFAVIMRPSGIYPITIAGARTAFPLAGPGPLSCFTKGAVIPKGTQSFVDPLVCRDTVANTDTVVSPLSVALGGVTKKAWPITVLAGAGAYDVSITNNSNELRYFSLFSNNSGSTAWSGPTIFTVPAHAGVSIPLGTPAFNITYYAAQLTDKAGTPINAPSDVHCDIAFVFPSARIVSATGDVGLTSFVPVNFIDQYSVRNFRVTAMSLLVTNMAAATEDGGLLVCANTRVSNINQVESISELASSIMALPETNRWNRGIVRDGAYTFYVPDDVDSYEPHHYNELNNDDNCLVAAGQLDTTSGSVSVLCTFVIEFYTKVQLFPRSVGPNWTDEYNLVLRALQSMRMASGNESHEAMVKRIAGRIRDLWKFALKHRDTIEMVSGAALSLL